MISAAIGSIRVGEAGAQRIERSGEWGFRYAAFAGSGFHVVLRGACWLIRDAEDPVRLRAGDVVFSPSGTGHGLSSEPRNPAELPPAVLGAETPLESPDVVLLCGAYRLAKGRVHPYLAAMPGIVAVSPDYDEVPLLRVSAEMLDAQTADGRPGTGVVRSALLDLLLVQMLREWVRQHHDATWPPLTDPAIAAALRSLHDRPGRPWTVEQLSGIAGMSRAAFTRRFTALTGTPPMTYLIRTRLGHGARLLRETAQPLRAIAREVGYATEYAFANAFRRVYGISPGRFRGAGPRDRIE